MTFNRDGGKTDEYGTHLVRQRLFTGEVAEGCQVVANASPSMGVRVQAGTMRIPSGTAPANFWYEAAIDTASPGEALTVTTANPSNPRRDYVVAYIDRSVTPSTSVTNNSNNVLKLTVVAGMAASTPADPTTSQITSAIGASNPYIVLARIAVGTAVTQITNSDITDLRTFITLGASNLAPSAITLASISSPTSQSGIGASDVMVTNLTATVTIPSGGRRVRVEGYIPRVFVNSVSTPTMSIYNAATVTGTPVQQSSVLMPIANNGIMMHTIYEHTPAAGSQSYCVALRTDVGAASTNLNAAALALLTVRVL